MSRQRRYSCNIEEEVEVLAEDFVKDWANLKEKHKIEELQESRKVS